MNNPNPNLNQAPSLSAPIRAGQSEAIAEAFARNADCQSAVPQAASLLSSHVVPASAGPAKSKIENLKSKIALLLGVSSVAFVISVAGDSAFPSAFSIQPLAFFADVPAPTAGALGSWLVGAAAALSILALGKQFMRKTPIEAEFLTKREFQDFKDKDFADLRNRIDHSHESLSNKLDAINTRLSDVGSLVARLDERTKVHAVHSPSTEPIKSEIGNRKSQIP
jgi:hypothetical protein